MELKILKQKGEKNLFMVTGLSTHVGDGKHISHFYSHNLLIQVGPKPEPKPGQNVSKAWKPEKTENGRTVITLLAKPWSKAIKRWNTAEVYIL